MDDGPDQPVEPPPEGDAPTGGLPGEAPLLPDPGGPGEGGEAVEPSKYIVGGTVNVPAASERVQYLNADGR